jgi:hypothetical protein
VLESQRRDAQKYAIGINPQKKQMLFTHTRGIVLSVAMRAGLVIAARAISEC